MITSNRHAESSLLDITRVNADLAATDLFIISALADRVDALLARETLPASNGSSRAIPTRLRLSGQTIRELLTVVETLTRREAARQRLQHDCSPS